MNATAQEASPRIRVLLVDDNPSLLDAMERFPWREAGMPVVGRACSGEEAIAALARVVPDLVLMDIAMPGMNGLAAATVIKARARAPKVIIVTIHDIPEYREAACGVGADGFVTKGEIGLALVPAIRALFPHLGEAAGAAR